MFIFKFITLSLNDSEHDLHEFIALHIIIYAEELVKYYTFCNEAMHELA